MYFRKPNFSFIFISAEIPLSRAISIVHNCYNKLLILVTKIHEKSYQRFSKHSVLHNTHFIRITMVVIIVPNYLSCSRSILILFMIFWKIGIRNRYLVINRYFIKLPKIPLNFLKFIPSSQKYH